MGIDILDIRFRLERRFKIRTIGEFITVFEKHTPPDVMAGELLAFILKTIGSPALPRDVEAEFQQDLTCVNCR